MTLDQLRIFVAVADKQHVSRAARELNLTQPATSAAIAALEGRYGTKLFDRVGRGIVLTHTGRTILAEARAVLASACGAPSRCFATSPALRSENSLSQRAKRLQTTGLRLSELTVQLELASNEAIRTAIESGVCATAISNLVVEKSIAAKALFRIEGELARRSFYVLRNKERHVSNAEAALLASIITVK